VHLVSGLAVEFDTRHADDVERVLDMALILAAGRARMFVELEGNEIQAFQVSVP
jgi:hypothetical protein